MYRTTVTLTLAALLLLGAATAQAEPTCEAIGESGEICHDIGEESGSISYEIADDELGLYSSGAVSYNLGL